MYPWCGRSAVASLSRVPTANRRCQRTRSRRHRTDRSGLVGQPARQQIETIPFQQGDRVRLEYGVIEQQRHQVIE